jgi:hypothetical protein
MVELRKIREFIAIMEGELIPRKTGTLKVELDPYMLYRTLLRMPAPENYIEPDGNNMRGLLTFIDPISYDDAKKKFDKFGIKYQEEDGKINSLWDNEHKPEDVFAVSPYPGNKATGDNTKDWDGKKSTVKSTEKIKNGPTGKNSIKK